VNSDIDFAGSESSLDFACEQTFATGAWIERLRRSLVATRFDDFIHYLQFRPRSLERFGHHRCLPARQLAAARTENDTLGQRSVTADRISP
jgi:hypothetical protein